MSKEIKMPQLSDTMFSGKIVAWRKKEGDPVKRGDILAEVETDKANLEIECFDQGTLLKIMVPAESEAKVGQVIAVVGEAGSVVADSTTSVSPTATLSQAASPIAPAAAVPVQGSSPSFQANLSAPAVSSPSGANRIKASPLAKRLAAERQINLGSIRGSGPEGRIIKRDLDSQRGGASGHSYDSPAPTTSGSVALSLSEPEPTSAKLETSNLTTSTTPNTTISTTTGSGRLSELTKMRATIARRMQESVREAPHFYLMTSIDMAAAMKLRERLKLEAENYAGISVNHLVIKAVGYALSKEPTVNNSIKDGKLYEPNEINIGIITATKDGLLIPVVKSVDKLSLKDLIFEAKAAVERARVGRPSSSDLLGGTFSISNLGMFGIERFTAIINPGQGGILAVGGIIDKPICKDGKVEPAPIMEVTLSVDHRIIDGVMGAKFLAAFKEALEMPALMLC